MKHWLLILIASGLCAVTARAGTVVLDGTVGPRGPILPDVNLTFTIDASMGAIRGNNLFHSFSQFNIDNGETASFTGPANIHNIIARVTGGSASTINGTIDTTSMPNANFFFINPFGVIFGQNAAVNVSGSFAVTTADYVRLADGGRFDARNPANDVLTAAPVSAFGFLGPTAAPITLAGVSTDPNNPPTLAFLPEGKSIWVVGGNIELDGFLLGAPGGEIVMVSVASAGELPVNVDDPNAVVDTSSFARLGNLTLTKGAGQFGPTLFTSGAPEGSVVLVADNIIITDGGGAVAENTGDTTGTGGIDLTARRSIDLNQAGLGTFADGNGDGGNIVLTAPSIQIVNPSINTDTIGNGKGGDIRITATDFAMSGSGGQIGITTSAAGAGGNLVLTADRVVLGAGVTLFGETFGGPAGKITVQADTVNLFQGCQIFSDGVDGGGVGGDIQITAHALTVGAPISSGSKGGGGGGGNIVLNVDHVLVNNGGQITTTSDNSAPAGSVIINGTDVIVDGASSIASAASANGTAGSITLNLTGSLLLQNEGALSVSAAQNTGGDITVTAGSAIRLIDGQITAQAQGDGGNVHLTTPSLIYLLDSQITAAAVTGHGGNIIIDPPLVVLNGSQINANAVQGNGGNINITSVSFLQSQSAVSASSQFGLQGSVEIVAPDVNLTGSLIPLSATTLDAESQLRELCAVRLPFGVSSFVVVGSGGTPVEPDDLSPAFELGGAGK